MVNSTSTGHPPIGPSAIGAAQTNRPDDAVRPTDPAPAQPNLTEAQRPDLRQPPNSQRRRERARFLSTNARSTPEQANIPAPAATQNEPASPSLDGQLTELLPEVASYLSKADRAEFRATSKAFLAAGTVAQRQLRVRNAADFSKALNAFAPGGLDSIDSSRAGLTEADAGLLAQPLPPRVNLQNNWIGSDGARALATNPSITRLDLSYNEITDEGAIALAANPTITSLDLRGNPIGPAGRQALEAVRSRFETLLL